MQTKNGSKEKNLKPEDVYGSHVMSHFIVKSKFCCFELKRDHVATVVLGKSVEYQRDWVISSYSLEYRASGLFLRLGRGSCTMYLPDLDIFYGNFWLVSDTIFL